MRNILDYGAVGDGVTVNTRAIQAAIDAGGAVYIPEGVFVTGTLHLKSGGGLFLAQGAVLKASHDRADYNAEGYCPQNRSFPGEFMVGTHLISAVEQDGVFLAGFGTIEGDSHYWVNESHTEGYCRFFAHPPLEANRPGQMVYFVECKNVKIESIRMHHAPFWHLFFHGCENVSVRGVTIEGERFQWVNDGIDIDCCKNVTVSDCLIDTGDDAITLRANNRQLLHNDGICENVVISNCVLTSYLDYGVRIGVGAGIIRNCLFSNIVIKDSLNGIGMTARFLAHSGGTTIENIRFQNLSISALAALQIRMSNEASHPPFEEYAYMKDIVFDGVTAYATRANLLAGFENADATDITFRNMKLYFSEEDPANDRHPCNWNDLRHKNAAFYVDRVKNVLFENVSFHYEDGLFEKGLFCERSENVELIRTNFKAE